MSEQPPTEYAPPGWYPDPTGLQAQRWWDGTQWGHQMRPLPGYQQQARQYPDAATPEAFWRESTGQYSQLSGPQDSTAYPASLPAAQPQLDPHQQAGWPPQSTGAPGPQPLGHRAPRRRNRGGGACWPLPVSWWSALLLPAWWLASACLRRGTGWSRPLRQARPSQPPWLTLRHLPLPRAARAKPRHGRRAGVAPTSRRLPQRIRTCPATITSSPATCRSECPDCGHDRRGW